MPCRVGVLGLCLFLLCACQSSVRSPVSGRACEAQKAGLLETVDALPAASESAQAWPQSLPVGALGGAVRGGEVLTLRSDGATWLGRTYSLETSEQLRALTEVLGGFEGPLLYVAAQSQVDMRLLQSVLKGIPETVELKLTYFIQAEAGGGAGEGSTGAGIAAAVLAERDASARQALAEEGYRTLSACDAVEEVVELAGAQQLPGNRWTVLKQRLPAALRSCKCGELDAEALELLLVAEQRAGSLAVGSFPIGFLRAARCAASMPLRSVQQLIEDIEGFDEEFAGDWHKDGLRFEKVLTTERLTNYLCVALPGETLAFLQRAQNTLYWRVPGQRGCQAWSFEPLAPGAPMGTWRRQGGDPLALHYWQGAEELRLFGPAEEGSRPTDKRSWACDETVKMTAIEGDTLSLKQGQWFLTRAACEAAPASKARLGGCSAQLASGQAVSPAPAGSPSAPVPLPAPPPTASQP